MRLKDGRGLQVLADSIQRSAAAAKNLSGKGSPLSSRADELVSAAELMSHTTALLVTAGKNDPERMISNSHVFLNFVGNIVIAWKWIEMETVAQRKIQLEANMSEDELSFYHSKVFMSEYYFKHELPKIHSAADLLNSLDDMNRSCPVSYF